MLRNPGPYTWMYSSAFWLHGCTNNRWFVFGCVSLYRNTAPGVEEPRSADQAQQTIFQRPISHTQCTLGRAQEHVCPLPQQLRLGFDLIPSYPGDQSLRSSPGKSLEQLQAPVGSLADKKLRPRAESTRNPAASNPTSAYFRPRSTAYPSLPEWC